MFSDKELLTVTKEQMGTIKLFIFNRYYMIETGFRLDSTLQEKGWTLQGGVEYSERKSHPVMSSNGKIYIIS